MNQIIETAKIYDSLAWGLNIKLLIAVICGIGTGLILLCILVSLILLVIMPVSDSVWKKWDSWANDTR